MQKFIVASGPVIIEDNKVLLDIQGEDNFWKFCGGKILEGETLWETAKRKAKEELGIEIEITDEKPFLMHITKETADGLVDIILVHYLARRTGEIRPGIDTREWKWILINELKLENIAPNIIPALINFGFA